MSYEFKLPDLGEGLTEGEVARWLVAEGQEIAEDDPLVEIATDKTTVEIPSPAAGIVSKILVAEGEVVPVGTVLVVIGGGGERPVPGTAAPNQVPARATPLVRSLAKELGVDLKQLLPLVLKAVASALHDFPELNARVDGNDLVLLDRYDIGIAVQTEQGLVVPVVRGCDSSSAQDIGAEVRRLAAAAQEGKLTPEELRGGTFTVTSAGRSAGLFVTPLINHPEVAILGIHRIEDRAVVRDGEVVVRKMGNVSVTFDHRVIDGKRAADFGLVVIAQLLQD